MEQTWGRLITGLSYYEEEKKPRKDWLGSKGHNKELNMDQQKEVWFKKHSGGKSFFLKICLFILERKGEKEEGQREKEERNPSKVLCWMLEPDMGLHLRTWRSWSEPKPRIGHLTDCATQVSLEDKIFYMHILYLNI